MTQPFVPPPTLLDLSLAEILRLLQASGGRISDLVVPQEIKERLRASALADLGVPLWLDLATAALELDDKPAMRQLLDRSPNVVADVHRSQVLSESSKQTTTEVIRGYQRLLHACLT